MENKENLKTRSFLSYGSIHITNNQVTVDEGRGSIVTHGKKMRRAQNFSRKI
jgi:hypothetical protein